MISKARRQVKERIEAQRLKTAKRCSGFRTVFKKNNQCLRRSNHAEITASLSTLTGEYTSRSEGVYSIPDDPYIEKIRHKIRIERLEQAEREQEDKAIEAVKDYDLQAKKYMAQGLTMSQAYIKALKERHLKYA